MVKPFLALAGPAEEALAIEVAVGYGMLFLAVLLTAVGLGLRSWRFELIPLGVLCLFTLLYMPWRVFGSVDAGGDSDVVYWLSEYRSLGIYWVIAALGTLAAIPITLSMRPKSFRRGGTRVDPQDAQIKSEGTRVRNESEKTP